MMKHSKQGRRIFCVFAVVIGLSGAEVKFPKDRRMDVLFPPKIDLPSGPGLPIGHLRPLGHQRRSSGEVKEIDSAVVNTSLGLHVVRNVYNSEQFWNIEGDSNNEMYSEVKLGVRQKKQDGIANLVKMTLTKLMENLDSEDWVLATLLPQRLLQDLPFAPAGLECFTDKLLKIEVEKTRWTTSDIVVGSRFNQLHCLTGGKRDYILSNLKGVGNVPMTQQGPCETLFTVDVNADMVNLFHHPWLSQLPWQHATLKPGDCVYIPTDYAIHTSSYGEECETLVYYFTESSSNCEKSSGIMQPSVCADEAGNQTFCNNLNIAAELRSLLNKLVDSNGKLSQRCFDGVSKHLLHVDKEKTMKNMYNSLGDIPVTKATLASLTESTMQRVLDMADTVKHSHDEL